MMSENFQKALDFTLKAEGGYVNDPLGGPTNRGVTQRTYDYYRKNNNLELRSVKLITDDEVKDLYFSLYWVPLGCDFMPVKKAVAMFDFGVHSGLGRAKSETIGCGDSYECILDKRKLFFDRLNKVPKFQPNYHGWINRLHELDKYLETL